jgi:hypothetical protein
MVSTAVLKLRVWNGWVYPMMTVTEVGAGVTEWIRLGSSSIYIPG